jgi:hypothetical protein
LIIATEGSTYLNAVVQSVGGMLFSGGWYVQVLLVAVVVGEEFIGDVVWVLVMFRHPDNIITRAVNTKTIVFLILPPFRQVITSQLILYNSLCV